MNTSYLESRLDVERTSVVRERSLPGTVLYLILFVSIIIATPFEARYPTQAWGWLSYFALLCAWRLWWILSWRKISQKRPVFWIYGFKLGFILNAIGWGLLCAFVVARFGLSWTSFFVLLLTAGLAAAFPSVQAPSIRMALLNLGLILVPAILVNFWVLGGLQGAAIGFLLLSYLVLLGLQSLAQYRQYWRADKSSKRIAAVFDAFPGTLVWISRDKKYLGVNKQQADLWGHEQADFIGKPIGYFDPKTYLNDFAEKIFDPQVNTYEKHLQRANKTFLLIGQKYHQGSEAVIMGVDVTQVLKGQK